MTVRARLTTDAVDSGTHWSKDSDLAALSRLFTGDPAVTTDHNGYYVTGAELDQAYAQQDGTDSIVAPRLVAKLNGAATLLIPDHVPIRWSGGIEAPGRVTGNISSSYRARAPRDLSTADPASAATVLQAAASDPALARVLDLLARIEPAWIWFDLWRIWEWLQARHPDGQAFVAWVNDDQARWDFRRSANDRALSGEAARHDTGNHEPRGRPISPEQALEFITGLVIRWIQEATGKTLQRSC